MPRALLWPANLSPPRFVTVGVAPVAMVLVSSNALRLTPTAPLDLPDLDLGLVLTLSQSFLCFDVLEKRGVAFVEAPREALPPRVDASAAPAR